jgi:hypothetical protein
MRNEEKARRHARASYKADTRVLVLGSWLRVLSLGWRFDGCGDGRKGVRTGEEVRFHQCCLPRPPSLVASRALLLTRTTTQEYMPAQGQGKAAACQCQGRLCSSPVFVQPRRFPLHLPQAASSAFSFRRGQPEELSFNVGTQDTSCERALP